MWSPSLHIGMEKIIIEWKYHLVIISKISKSVHEKAEDQNNWLQRWDDLKLDYPDYCKEIGYEKLPLGKNDTELQQYSMVSFN